MKDIEVVIKIPEELYIACEKLCKTHHLSRVEDAIGKGTPLPKGHKRLIEDKFEVGPVFDEEGNRVGYKYVTQEDLSSAETIIEADTENEAEKDEPEQEERE